MIPESLQVALERTGLPVKERYTQGEMYRLLHSTQDLARTRSMPGKGYAMSQEEAGALKGISRSFVCQIEKRARQKLLREGGLYADLV